jgi:hypothetical protein
MSLQMVRYYRFGTEMVASEIVLPGLSASSNGARTAAITVRRTQSEDVPANWSPQPAPQVRPDPSGLRVRRWRSADGGWHRLRYGYRHHFAEFVIRQDGGEVRAHASGEISDGELASLLEGVILGGAMRLLGNACLHATVLTAEGRAVALLGQSGVGKSSLAWAMVRQGCRLLSDDFAAFSLCDDVLFVQPGRTKLRLWPDAAKRLIVGAASVARLYPMVVESEKLVVTDPEAVESVPTRLHAIYLLNRRDAKLREPLIEEMPPHQRLVTLAANLYGAIVPGPEARRKELSVLAKVAAAVPVCGLTLPDSLDALPGAAEQLRLCLLH